MPLSANLFRLESSISTRAKWATNRNNVAIEKQSYIFLGGGFYPGTIWHTSEQGDLAVANSIQKLSAGQFEAKNSWKKSLKVPTCAQWLPWSPCIYAKKTIYFVSISCSCIYILASLDVESLFTNVPIDETINIIINYTKSLSSWYSPSHHYPF